MLVLKAAPVMSAAPVLLQWQEAAMVSRQSCSGSIAAMTLAAAPVCVCSPKPSWVMSGVWHVQVCGAAW